MSEIARRFFFGGRREGMPHAGLHEGVVNILVTKLAGVYAHVSRRIGMVQVNKGVFFYGWGRCLVFFSVAGKKKYEENDGQDLNSQTKYTS